MKTTKIIELLPGHRFGNYVLRKGTKISFDFVDDKSVVAVILEVGIAESGESEREATVNLESFISDILDDYRADPEKQYGRRLLEQMRLLDEIMEQK